MSVTPIAPLTEDGAAVRAATVRERRNVPDP
jgi:hypothetical protein